MADETNADSTTIGIVIDNATNTATTATDTIGTNSTDTDATTDTDPTTNTDPAVDASAITTGTNARTIFIGVSASIAQAYRNRTFTDRVDATNDGINGNFASTDTGTKATTIGTAVGIDTDAINVDRTTTTTNINTSLNIHADATAISATVIGTNTNRHAIGINTDNIAIGTNADNAITDTSTTPSLNSAIAIYSTH